MVYTTDGPIALGQGLAFTSDALIFDPGTVPAFGVTSVVGAFGNTATSGIQAIPTEGDVVLYLTQATPINLGGVYGHTAPSGGDSNTYLGTFAGSGVTTGDSNVLIGLSAGLNYTTESNNIVIGTSTAGVVGDSGVIRINSDGATASLLINGDGACSFSTSGFGTSGQVLTSGGSSNSPTWGNPPIQTITGTIPGTGVATPIFTFSPPNGSADVYRVFVGASSANKRIETFDVSMGYVGQGALGPTGANSIAQGLNWTSPVAGDNPPNITLTVTTSGTDVVLNGTAADGGGSFAFTAQVFQLG